MTGYTYDSNSDQATAHHEALSALLDPFTQRRILGLLPSLDGLQCWDAGAGAGSVAVWLADQVGPDGYVCATDIDTGLMPTGARITVLEHDIAKGTLPEGGRGFDLVHARLVLNHEPERIKALANLIEALKPGGILLTGDFNPTLSKDFVHRAPTAEAASLLQQYQFAHLELLRKSGNDRNWSTRAAWTFESRGLVDVQEMVHSTGLWYVEGPGRQMHLAVLHQIGGELVENYGFLDVDMERLARLFEDPDVVLNGYEFISVSGKRPVDA